MQDKAHQFWKFHEFHEAVGLDLGLALLAEVQVAAVHRLGFEVALQPQLYRVVVQFGVFVLYGDYDVLERLLAGLLVTADPTACVVQHDSLVEFSQEFLLVLLLDFEGLLERLEQNPVELLYVLLLECFLNPSSYYLTAPLEAPNKFPRVHIRREFGFEFGEQLLKLKQDAVLLAAVDLLVVAPTVDGVAELRSHEQGLQQAVHVACRPDIGQAFVALHIILQIDRQRYLISG